jgi:hypothetical protein
VQVLSFSVVVERNELLRVADKIKFELGTADDVVEVLFELLLLIGDADA